MLLRPPVALGAGTAATQAKAQGHLGVVVAPERHGDLKGGAWRGRP